MAHDSDSAAAHAFILQTYELYASLMQMGRAELRADAADLLGGHLFWVGELDETGRALAVAGNIAGAATLATAKDLDAQRLAVRDGIVDFLVNSLDEALRILKNEVRKRETVAVCVAASAHAVEAEMEERGVLPDVLRERVPGAAERTNAEPGPEVAVLDPIKARALLVWKVDRAPALWLPKVDAIALECLGPDEPIARHWLLRSSRYLGRLGQAEHLVKSNRAFAECLVMRLRAMAESGELKVGGCVEVVSGADRELFVFGKSEGEALGGLRPELK